MVHKWVGALLVILSSGGFGIILAWNQTREEHLLAQLSEILDYMESQLAYRLTPLPELCREAGQLTSGVLGQVLITLSRLLEENHFPEVSGCMQEALISGPNIPPIAKQTLLSLGETLGRFDLPGQRKGLLSLRGECRRQLQLLRQDRNQRLRSMRTLGFCAGAALIIILM